MKKAGLIFALLTALSLACYCQDAKTKDENLHFIETGGGAGYTRQVHGDLNVALSNSLGRHIASFIDYNMAFGKSNTLFHEINMKLGPYFQFNRFSYLAVSTGISFIYNSQHINENGYDNFYGYYYNRYSEPDYLINIPVQAKLNIGLYKGICMGVKGTLNKMIDEGVEDKGTVVMYLGFGW